MNSRTATRVWMGLLIILISVWVALYVPVYLRVRSIAPDMPLAMSEVLVTRQWWLYGGLGAWMGLGVILWAFVRPDSSR